MHIINKYFVFAITLCSISILPGDAKQYEKMGILGGDLRNTGEISYMVAVLLKDQNNNPSILCGGGIITDNLIISAASCFIDEDYEFYDDVLSVGTLGVDPDDSLKIVDIDVNIEKVYVPKNYNATTHQNDIALVKLKKSLETEKYKLTKLRIPTKTRSNFAGKDAVIAGYGWDEVSITVDGKGVSEKTGDTQGLLYSANAKVLNNDQCKDQFSESIADSIMCAKIVKENIIDRRYGTCDMDEGGPLVYKSKTIIGVLIKTTEACDETGDPAQYTRIATQLDFIKDAMDDRDENMLTFTHETESA